MSLSASINRSKNIRKLINDLGHQGRTQQEKVDHILTAYYTSLKPTEIIDFDIFMDTYIYLASESSAEAGLFRTARFPFLRKIMKKLSVNSYAKKITFMKGSQVAATTILTGWYFYLAKIDPSPLMMLQPVATSLKKWKTTKLKPMANASPEMKAVFGDDIPQSMANNAEEIGFVGGSLNFATSKSPNSVASTSIKYGGVDEADRCEKDVGGEGSSIGLFDRRMSNFDGKAFYNSTPNMKDTSAIEELYDKGTKEIYVLPCPHCNDKLDYYGTYFMLTTAFLKVENRDPTTTQCLCPVCGALILEYHKTWMLENGFWWRLNPTPLKDMATDETRIKILTKCEKYSYHTLEKEEIQYLINTSEDDEIETDPSFHISALYSPLGFYSWAAVMKDFFAAVDSKDKSLMKTFRNTVEGLTWDESISMIDHRHLKGRIENFSQDGSFEVPANGVVITAGVDVQKDRLELMTIAHGEHGEQFIIDYRIFYGDSKVMGDDNLKFHGSPTCWLQLYEYLGTTFRHESGKDLGIDITLIDSRYNSTEVFKFCQIARLKNVFPCHGKEGWGKGTIERAIKPNKHGVKNHKIYTDGIKVSLSTALANEKHGINSIRFSRNVKYPENFFKGITIERLKERHTKNGTIKYWYNPPHGRNEPTDTYCYATGGVAVLRPAFKARYAALYNDKPVLRRKKRKLSTGI